MMKKIQVHVFTLLLLSLLLVLIQSSSQRTINILDYPGITFSDSEFHQGLSSSTILSSDAQQLIYECDLRKAYQWPFCEYEFKTNEHAIGFDLSSMSTLNIKMNVLFNGRPTSETPIRIYLKHYEPEIVETSGLKTNQIEFDMSDFKEGIELPLGSLQVADWWRRENNISVEYGYADISNIHYISIATASEAPEGVYRFTVETMEVSGKWISDETFYRLLLAFWLLSASLYLVISFVYAIRQNRRLKNENAMLRVSNHEYIVKASYDSLTGALNRGGSEVVIDDLMNSCASLVIIYLDLDRFKSINDRHGHQCGDSVLQLFSRCVRHIKGEGQHFIRWGGEEFLLICEDIRLDEGIQVAKGIQQKMTNQKWPYSEQITCSIGVAELLSNEKIELTIERADKALYQAKRLGRNRIELAV
ncbi:GGDEF domain-containing protein [Vibrio sp. ZSDE26]|uniref:diguanylate cyclase n=1 Tax=Vibrio amylolyticus TaxID=2847292 RepID=A0A9X2BL13_9VIBR|nr:GGDEF domain-containing protein [Vibrio amylolyticus]MCK6263438.1 GGDEF domain-containing protein [Vibrio amylolyticus]